MRQMDLIHSALTIATKEHDLALSWFNNVIANELELSDMQPFRKLRYKFFISQGQPSKFLSRIKSDKIPSDIVQW